MSSGPENTFIRSVHAHLPGGLYHMKNHNEYNGGIADCWYSARHDLWIEWKFVAIPKRDATLIDLHAGKKPAMSALQKEWLKNRLEEGRNVWVGIGSKTGGVILRDLEWEQPITARDFRARIVDRKALAGVIAGFVQGDER